MLDKKAKEKIIKKFKVHDTDTGSTPVQIAILTEEIKKLTEHLKDHKKDFSSRRGLLKKVAERRQLLHYLYREDKDAHDKIVKSLKLRVIQTAAEKKSIDLLEEEAAEAIKAESEEADILPNA